MKIWSNDEINLAIKRCEDGWKYEDIAEELGRTKKSIRVKLNRLGYKLNKNTYYEQKLCECCGKTFSFLKTEKRKYCSQSCAAIKNNSLYPKREKINKRKRREYNKRKKNLCLNCENLTTNKFCSNKCQQKYWWKKKVNEIENGNLTYSCRIYKKYLINKYGNKCMKCGWNKKHPITGNVPIELEHIDGNSENNNLNNLKLLCPNCHSLTPTYKALNNGNGRYLRKKRYQENKSY